MKRVRLRMFAVLVAGSISAQEAPVVALPDTPRPQEIAQSADFNRSVSGNVLTPRVTRQPMTVHDKFTFYLHQAFTPLALVPPAMSAGIVMANPPERYPHELRAGGGAFGRLYGEFLVRRESQQAAQFVGQAVFHEDPRYLPSSSHKVLARISDALLFTLIDRSDAGNRMPALSNFVGATANGVVGTAFLPNGYDDSRHAARRSAIILGGFAANNLANEFCPQWGPLVNKLHLPLIHPSCSDRIRKLRP